MRRGDDVDDFGEQRDVLVAPVGLLLLGYLWYPRGAYASFRERARQAVARLNAPVVAALIALGIGWVAAGSWIFYNTNVLNPYRTEFQQEELRARYEAWAGRRAN